ncbi:flagellar protein FlaG [Pseudomonas stutzeri]|nr:flagellar protein FlaG [Stutzerimonas stutzeri]
MSITNLDVTALFPFPGELASRPLEGVRAAGAMASVGAAGGAEKAAEQAPAPEAANAASLAASVQQLNAELQSFGIEFEFSDSDHRLITRVVDSETGELIRQIPSEEVLRMARSLAETSGRLLQTSA